MRLLNEEQQKWVDIIGEFAKKEIEPIMLDWDKVVDPSKAIPFDAYAKAPSRSPRSTAATRSPWTLLKLCTKRWATMTATSLPSCRPPTWL